MKAICTTRGSTHNTQLVEFKFRFEYPHAFSDIVFSFLFLSFFTKLTVYLFHFSDGKAVRKWGIDRRPAVSNSGKNYAQNPALYPVISILPLYEVSDFLVSTGNSAWH